MPRYQNETSMFRSVNEERRFYARPFFVWFVPTGTAATAGLLFGFLIGIISWSRGDEQPVITGLIAMLIITIGVWLYLTLWVLGKLAMRPVRQPKQVTSVRIEWPENKGRTLKIHELESVDDDRQLYKICRMYYQTQRLTYDSLSPYFQNSRANIAAFRNELVAKNLAINISGGGIELTDKGFELFVNFMRSYESSPPRRRQINAKR